MSFIRSKSRKEAHQSYKGIIRFVILRKFFLGLTQ